MLNQPSERRDTIVNRSRKGLFRCQTIIHEQNRGLGAAGDFSGQRPVRIDRADDITPAVQIEDGPLGLTARCADPFRGAVRHAHRLCLNIVRSLEGQLFHAFAHGLNRRLNIRRKLSFA